MCWERVFSPAFSCALAYLFPSGLEHFVSAFSNSINLYIRTDTEGKLGKSRGKEPLCARKEGEGALNVVKRACSSQGNLHVIDEVGYVLQ